VTCPNLAFISFSIVYACNELNSPILSGSDGVMVPIMFLIFHVTVSLIPKKNRKFTFLLLVWGRGLANLDMEHPDGNLRQAQRRGC